MRIEFAADTLGRCYQEGVHGFKRDKKKASKWLGKVESTSDYESFWGGSIHHKGESTMMVDSAYFSNSMQNTLSLDIHSKSSANHQSTNTRMKDSTKYSIQSEIDLSCHSSQYSHSDATTATKVFGESLAKGKSRGGMFNNNQHNAPDLETGALMPGWNFSQKYDTIQGGNTLDNFLLSSDANSISTATTASISEYSTNSSRSYGSKSTQNDAGDVKLFSINEGFTLATSSGRRKCATCFEIVDLQNIIGTRCYDCASNEIDTMVGHIKL